MQRRVHEVGVMASGEKNVATVQRRGRSGRDHRSSVHEQPLPFERRPQLRPSDAAAAAAVVTAGVFAVTTQRNARRPRRVSFA